MTPDATTLTIKQAVDFLARHGRPVTARQLRNRVARGAVPAFMSGKRLVFLRSALVQAIAENVL